MRLVIFSDPHSRARLGALEDGHVIDLTAAGLPDDMTELIRGGAPALAAARDALASGARIPSDDVTLHAPVRHPPKNVICVGRNYRDHAVEFSRSGFDASERSTVPDHPVIFTKAPSSIVGPGDPIVAANDPTGTVDYEGELAVVIGTGARGIPRASAMEHVCGYTIVNDVTARALQQRHVQWFIGKSVDSFCPMGPALVTADEIDDIGSCRLTTRVNGEVRQDAPIADLIFDIPALIETISAAVTLEAGDVIATGTPQGVGIGEDPPRFLAPGDVVEISIDGLGTLRNPVV